MRPDLRTRSSLGPLARRRSWLVGGAVASLTLVMAGITAPAFAVAQHPAQLSGVSAAGPVPDQCPPHHEDGPRPHQDGPRPHHGPYLVHKLLKGKLQHLQGIMHPHLRGGGDECKEGKPRPHAPKGDKAEDGAQGPAWSAGPAGSPGPAGSRGR